MYFGNSVRIFGLGIAASVFRKIISVNQGSSTVEKLEFPSFFLASETVMPERACLRETAVFMTADQMQTTKTETVQSRLVATARTFSCASLADSRDRPLTRLIAGTDPSHDRPLTRRPRPLTRRPLTRPLTLTFCISSAVAHSTTRARSSRAARHCPTSNAEGAWAERSKDPGNHEEKNEGVPRIGASLFSVD